MEKGSSSPDKATQDTSGGPQAGMGRLRFLRTHKLRTQANTSKRKTIISRQVPLSLTSDCTSLLGMDFGSLTNS